MENIARHGKQLINKLGENLRNVPGIHILSGEGQVLSIIIDHMDNGTAAVELEERWGIMTRIGLHCAPLAHQTLGTYPNGTIRFAVSHFTTEEQIDICIKACKTLAEESWEKK